MRFALSFRASAAGLILLVSPRLHGQKNTDCEVKAPTDKSCAVPQTPAPVPASSAASQHPYPGDNTGKPALSAPASKQFPYPGDAATKDGGVPSSSSSSSSAPDSQGVGSSSAVDPDDPLDPDTATAQPPGRRKLPKVKNLQNDDDREAEDVKVAGFYRDQGNNPAAYNRLKDAVKLVSDDADAWYLLGEVAAKMNKLEESSDAYRRFLELETGTRRAKALEKQRPELHATR